MHITPTNDDSKVQSLSKPAAEKGAETKPVTELEKTKASVPITNRHEHVARQPVERRLYQRRKQEDQVVLDTRDHHERRALKRRKEDREPPAESNTESVQGIDVKA